MSSFRERLMLFIDYTGLRPSNIEDEAELSRSTLIKILDGNIKSLSSKSLIKINKRFPELNIDWLQFGTGDMIKKYTKAVQNQPEQINEPNTEYISGIEKELLEILRENRELKKQISDLEKRLGK
jgi:hypothetical protein